MQSEKKSLKDWDLSSEDIPTLQELIAKIDKLCYGEIIADSTGAMMRLYRFYDSIIKPLGTLEFMEYWWSLTEEEQMFFKLFPGWIPLR